MAICWAQVHSDKDAMQRALVEAQSEKQAVMQAGEVLLAELEQLHEARDDAQRRLTGARLLESRAFAASRPAVAAATAR